MGKPMAANLIKAGHELVVYNRSINAVRDLEELGAVCAKSPEEVAGGSGVVFLCLPKGSDVIEVVSGKCGVLSGTKVGTMIVDHSTISPQDSKQMYLVCKEKGVAFLDAPVSGGVTGAEAGTLSIMVGGDKVDYERVHSLLEIMGEKIYYLGGSGSGNVMKLVNNLLVGITNAALAEAFVLAAKGGLDTKEVYDILSNATGDSVMLRRNIQNFVLKKDFSPAFTLDMLNKDMALAEEMAKDMGVRLLLGSLAHQIGREAGYLGYGENDMAVVIKSLEKITNLEITVN